jgi:hypothetical protein
MLGSLPSSPFGQPNHKTPYINNPPLEQINPQVRKVKKSLFFSKNQKNKKNTF